MKWHEIEGTEGLGHGGVVLMKFEKQKNPQREREREREREETKSPNLSTIDTTVLAARFELREVVVAAPKSITKD